MKWLLRQTLGGALTWLVACGGAPQSAQDTTVASETPRHAKVVIEGSSLVLMEDAGSVPLVVYFENDSDVIETDSYPALAALAAFLRNDGGDLPVEVQGHADERGSNAYNEALSVRRAEAVKRYLVEQGVDARSLRTIGYGETHPVATGDHADLRRNRRVEFAVSQAPAQPDGPMAAAHREPGKR